MAALLAVPETKAGQRPAVLLPNPFYVCYQGGAGMSGGEAVYLDATAETGFLPDLDAIDTATLERTALFYLVSPGNPQGACASLEYLKRAIALARKYDFVLALDRLESEWKPAPRWAASPRTSSSSTRSPSARAQRACAPASSPATPG